MDKPFCILNGEIEKIANLNLAPIFAINDFVSDNIRLYNTKALCLGSHIQNIKNQLEKKGKVVPEKFSTENLERYIPRLLNINKVYKGGICKLLIFWQTFPEQTEAQFIIFIDPLDFIDYEFNTQGFKLEFCNIQQEFYDYTLTNCIPNQDETERIFFDKYGKAFSSINNDIILLKDNTLIVGESTLPITSSFINFLSRKNWEIVRIPFFKKEDFYNSSEIMICNQFSGIQWIKRTYEQENANQYKSFATFQAKNLETELMNAIKEM
ncbi:MAG: hypothetical protein MJ198_04660 [Bacteroidales bacterium]|nr:hypothetical protein [Bacteroidales bacterium]